MSTSANSPGTWRHGILPVCQVGRKRRVHQNVAEFNEQRDTTINGQKEATYIGFRMRAQAVSQAGTVDVEAVRQAMYGQRVRGAKWF
ncbi:transporter substrate-binding protein [Bradyrhizobium japonicum]|uniref:transporter substrate-binding protein n=1 Tax=Bradyrhizobium japonicum TaxID=375 RepID=UPI0027145411|nr:transporter substrate-binding protein [Bradyrhizobium japonicum]WLB58815.1 transporter substrate-binding protein [Bradyrhizobium japonicum]WLB59384.1 transporter substrate-binding protein [Bradyrhizobium japonicum]